MHIQTIVFSFLIVYCIAPLPLICMQQPEKINALLKACEDIEFLCNKNKGAIIGLIGIGLGVMTDNPVMTISGGFIMFMASHYNSCLIKKISKKAHRCLTINND